jgi:hypothetical protein
MGVVHDERMRVSSAPVQVRVVKRQVVVGVLDRLGIVGRPESRGGRLIRARQHR